MLVELARGEPVRTNVSYILCGIPEAGKVELLVPRCNGTVHPYNKTPFDTFEVERRCEQSTTGGILGRYQLSLFPFPPQRQCSATLPAEPRTSVFTQGRSPNRVLLQQHLRGIPELCYWGASVQGLGAADLGGVRGGEKAGCGEGGGARAGDILFVLAEKVE